MTQISLKKPLKNLPTLFISALGIVYGDIGTSPLYALRSCFSMSHLGVTPSNIYGIISLFIWTLIFIVFAKYVMIVMRADDQGEGGILVLSSLCHQLVRKKYRWVMLTLGISGTTLFFGDGIITPAISVLSALEGLTLVHPKLGHLTTYLAIAILIGLFTIQKNGSSQIGKYYGPLILIWFLVLGYLGAVQIIKNPAVLVALNPWCAVQFLMVNKVTGLLTLGGVILVVTGAEALYADLGHFGRRPIVTSWSFIVFPALILNYLGQGALVFQNPSAIANPFYLMAAGFWIMPLTLFSTIITVIAAQAVISGVFSLCWQAINLGYIPRLKIVHTSTQFIGQVYIPTINWILCCLTILAVVLFKTSDNLAIAYGLNVSFLMVTTSILTIVFVFNKFKWGYLRTVLIMFPIVILEALFFSVNLSKIVHGAWFTLAITGVSAYLISIWRQGNQILTKMKRNHPGNLRQFLSHYVKKQPRKIPATAIFITRFPNHIPISLINHLKFNKFLHRKLLIVTINIEGKAIVRRSSHFKYQIINDDTYQIIANYGFKQIPDFNELIHWAEHKSILKAHEKPALYVSKGIPVSNIKNGWFEINKTLYILLARNSLTSYEYYKIPINHMLEMGIRYEI